VHAATRSAASVAQPFKKGPRAGQPVQSRHVSFTTTRRTLIATVRAGTATASLPAPARAAAHHADRHAPTRSCSWHWVNPWRSMGDGTYNVSGPYKPSGYTMTGTSTVGWYPGY
jgi:hypothetical protein